MATTDLHKYTVAEKLNKMDVDLITKTPTTTTAECVVGDVVFQADTLANCVAVAGGTCILQSIVILDEDYNGQPLDLVFMDPTALLDDTSAGGTEIDAADGSIPDSIIAIVPVTSYFDGIAWKVGYKNNIGTVLKAASGATSIYVSAVNRGATATWTAAGLRLRIGIVKD